MKDCDGRGMLKMTANKAAGELQPEAYPLGYVEDCFDPRTKLEAFFTIPASGGAAERL
jgi:hypothetical protein